MGFRSIILQFCAPNNRYESLVHGGRGAYISEVRICTLYSEMGFTKVLTKKNGQKTSKQWFRTPLKGNFKMH
jgi:hypothetical protein